jgi:hypothetical protein
MSNVFLVKDNGNVRAFLSESEMNDAGFQTADMTVTDEQYNSNGCYARIIDGNIVIGKTEAEIAAEEAAEEMSEIKAEIAARDYRALKAIKLGITLEEAYPGESAWYQEKLDRVHELEEILGIE